MGGRSDGRFSDRPRFDDRGPQNVPLGDQNKGQLNDISIKLDKILRLLEPKVEVKVVSAPVIEEIKATKTPKVKKQVKSTPVKK